MVDDGTGTRAFQSYVTTSSGLVTTPPLVLPPHKLAHANVGAAVGASVVVVLVLLLMLSSCAKDGGATTSNMAIAAMVVVVDVGHFMIEFSYWGSEIKYY